MGSRIVIFVVQEGKKFEIHDYNDMFRKNHFSVEKCDDLDKALDRVKGYDTAVIIVRDTSSAFIKRINQLKNLEVPLIYWDVEDKKRPITNTIIRHIVGEILPGDLFKIASTTISRFRLMKG